LSESESGQQETKRKQHSTRHDGKRPLPVYTRECGVIPSGPNSPIGPISVYKSLLWEMAVRRRDCLHAGDAHLLEGHFGGARDRTGSRVGEPAIRGWRIIFAGYSGRAGTEGQPGRSRSGWRPARSQPPRGRLGLPLTWWCPPPSLPRCHARSI
jgi:hypothetical protein